MSQDNLPPDGVGGCLRKDGVPMPWLAVSACAAFLITVWLEGFYWGPRNPYLIHGLAAFKSLLWLPVPALSCVLTGMHTADAYAMFVAWGTVGFLLQIVAHTLRLTQERTIERAVHEWMLVSDRRYWELEYKSTSALAGPFWQHLSSVPVMVWALALAVLLRRTTELVWLPGFIGLCAFIAIILAGCYLTADVMRLRGRWVAWAKGIDAGHVIARICVYGLITGWLVVESLIY